MARQLYTRTRIIIIIMVQFANRRVRRGRGEDDEEECPRSCVWSAAAVLRRDDTTWARSWLAAFARTERSAYGSTSPRWSAEGKDQRGRELGGPHGRAQSLFVRVFVYECIKNYN